MGNACSVFAESDEQHRSNTQPMMTSIGKPGKVEWSNVDWIEDDDVCNCMGCDVIFTGITRKHHCRACGRVFCAKCTRWKAAVSCAREDRVCKYCKNYLDKRTEWEDRASSTKESNNSNFILFKGGMFGGVTIHLMISNKRLILMKDPHSLEPLESIELEEVTGVTEGSTTSVLRKSKASAMITFTITLRNRSINLAAPGVKIRGKWIRAIRTYLDFKRMKLPSKINKDTEQKLDNEKAHQAIVNRRNKTRKREAVKAKYAEKRVKMLAVT